MLLYRSNVSQSRRKKPWPKAIGMAILPALINIILTEKIDGSSHHRDVFPILLYIRD